MSYENILSFSFVAFMMVLSPGPNMIYLISRSIAQGRKAGFLSLLGGCFGFIIYMLLTAFGLTAVLLSTPHLYDVIRYVGALYLLWLAWKAIKFERLSSVFELQKLEHDSNLKLFGMGFLTNLLNPKIAIMYLSLLPQFIDSQDHIFIQSIFLGSLQILISFSVNLLIVLFSSHIAHFLIRKPNVALIQRYFMGAVLAILAVKIFVE